MAAIIDLMLAIRENSAVFYHRDTNEFDGLPFSAIEMKTLDSNARLPMHDENNFRLPSYQDVNHEDIMRFYVRECVEDKAIRKKLFHTLQRKNYMEPFLTELRELNLYDDFIDICGDIYIQIFEEWAEKNRLNF